VLLGPNNTGMDPADRMFVLWRADGGEIYRAC